MTVEYNKTTEIKKPWTRDKPYISPYEKVRPLVHKDSDWYADRANWNTCIRCKENKCVQTKFGLVAWCEICYPLLALRHDGTFHEKENRIGLAQDFDDLQKGKVEIKTQERMIRDVIEDELPPVV